MMFKIVLFVSLFVSSLSLFAKSEGKLINSYPFKRGVEAYKTGNNQKASLLLGQSVLGCHGKNRD